MLFLTLRWKNDTTHDTEFSRMFIVTTCSIHNWEWPPHRSASR